MMGVWGLRPQRGPGAEPLACLIIDPCGWWRSRPDTSKKRPQFGRSGYHRRAGRNQQIHGGTWNCQPGRDCQQLVLVGLLRHGGKRDMDQFAAHIVAARAVHHLAFGATHPRDRVGQIASASRSGCCHGCGARSVSTGSHHAKCPRYPQVPVRLTSTVPVSVTVSDAQPPSSAMCTSKVSFIVPGD